MQRVLLVAPVPLRFELTQDDAFLKLPFARRAKSFLMPLHIATVAAVTPDEFQVDLWDESTMGPATEADLGRYDLVGITGYTAHLPRAKAIAQFCRERGVPVAIGGPGISTMPQRHYDDFDILFIGEAELTWPQFLNDWKRGSHQKVYRQVAPVDLALSPIPRWDSITNQLPYYHLGGVQTSRGCPFDCEFCDVSYLFGRRYRYKPIENVLKELLALERLGVWRISFCDDNFIGNRRYAKDLLREIISLNRSLRQPLRFATELTIDVAQDDELLALLADASFVEIFIGIESPNKDSLREANKPQNVTSDLVKDVQKVQSYGLAVRGSLIVGFDHDDKSIFDHHYRFVGESCVAVPSVRVLMAPPGTQLWQRLRKEGRLLKTETEGRYFGNPGTTNIIPKGMSRSELHTGYLQLIEKMYDWDNFAARVKGFVGGVTRRPDMRMTLRDWQRLIPFARFVLTRLDRRSRPTVLGIMWHALRVAPFMLPRLVGLISRQYGYAERPKLRAAIERLIEQEETAGFALELDREDPVLSPGFRKASEEILVELCGDVYERLADKSAVEEALIQILVDFVTRHGSNLESFSPERRGQLTKLVEEAIADKNTAGDGVPHRQPSRRQVMTDVPRMSDRILNAVEQELLIAQARASAPRFDGTHHHIETEIPERPLDLPIGQPTWGD